MTQCIADLIETAATHDMSIKQADDLTPYVKSARLNTILFLQRTSHSLRNGFSQLNKSGRIMSCLFYFFHVPIFYEIGAKHTIFLNPYGMTVEKINRSWIKLLRLRNLK